jgi:hypothetical protein
MPKALFIRSPTPYAGDAAQADALKENHVKRAFVLVGLAFLIPVAPAHAQQDGEWQIKNDEVQATGNATGGTCDPTDFQYQVEMLFGPGNRVETVQGDQRTVGKFDPETGKITTSSGPESYTLEPDGKKRLTGAITYNDCRWKIDLDLNKPGLAFAGVEAVPDPAASPITQEETAGAPLPAGAAADSKTDDKGLDPLIPIGVATIVVVAGAGTAVVMRRRAKADAGAGLSGLAIGGVVGGAAAGGLVAARSAAEDADLEKEANRLDAKRAEESRRAWEEEGRRARGESREQEQERHAREKAAEDERYKAEVERIREERRTTGEDPPPVGNMPTPR